MIVSTKQKPFAMLNPESNKQLIYLRNVTRMYYQELCHAKGQIYHAKFLA